MTGALHDILRRATVIPVIVIDDIRHAVPLAEALVAGDAEAAAHAAYAAMHAKAAQSKAKTKAKAA